MHILKLFQTLNQLIMVSPEQYQPDPGTDSEQEYSSKAFHPDEKLAIQKTTSYILAKTDFKSLADSAESLRQLIIKVLPCLKS